MAVGGVGLAELIPDSLDSVPPSLVTVEYPGGLKLETGGVLTPTQVKDCPVISWPAEEDTFHTLMVIDPDAPSRSDPNMRHWLHMLVVNIPGCRVGEGEELFGYVGSAPPQGTGLHRYVFVALKQEDKLVYEGQRSNSTSLAGRGQWDNKAFISKHSLQPVAANYYRAEWDDYVPIVYASFK